MFKLTVLRGQDGWMLYCDAIGDEQVLKATDADAAKAEALGIFAGTLREALKQVE